MNYLGRQVFQFDVDWSEPVTKQFSYDMREVMLGFGAEVFESTQQNTVQGYDINVNLTTPALIASFDAFLNPLYGRQSGFWLPTPFDAGQAVAAIDTTHFKIAFEELNATWADHPDIYLYFTADGQAPVAAKITAVANNGDGTETITIDTAVAFLSPFGANLRVQRLHYVRQADDTEQAKFVGEGWQTRTLKVLELPTEYTNVETGQTPIYLYHFSLAAPMQLDWYFTSFAASVVSNNVFYNASSITHGTFTRGTDPQAETLEIDAAYNANHPLSLFLPTPFPRPMTITIYQVTFADTNTQTLVFSGTVRTVEDAGDQLKASCESFWSVFRRKVPWMLIKPTCNYYVFEPNTCKLLRAYFETTVTISALGNSNLPPSVNVTLNFPSATLEALNYFAQGWLETGYGATAEVRTIIGSTYAAPTLTLTLNAPLQFAQVGQQMQLIPGCDGQASTCQTKFNNYANFLGFPFLPLRNPALQAINSSTSQGGKK
jgi:uncharacterized phage protein (TIGR02218 family)